MWWKQLNAKCKQLIIGWELKMVNSFIVYGQRVIVVPEMEGVLIIQIVDIELCVAANRSVGQLWCWLLENVEGKVDGGEYWMDLKCYWKLFAMQTITNCYILLLVTIFKVVIVLILNSTSSWWIGKFN